MNEKGISVAYTAYGFEEEKIMEADYFVNAISLPVFRNIPVIPPLSSEKQYVVDNLKFSPHILFMSLKRVPILVRRWNFQY